MTRLRPRRRLPAGLALALAAVLALTVLEQVPGSTPSPAPGPQLQLTADPSQFRPGNIISDNLFFDGNAMTADAVQSFLDAKGASCTAGAMPCLKDYRQDTPSRAADAYCAAYPGARAEPAATIIAQVGRACGISQRVLLVLLQKEQSLVRATEPSARQYQKATGYGCPDTAPCDAQYYGFFNQVYTAARRFQVYAANPDVFNYQAGRVNSILYNPDTSCGRSDVYLENQATAGLYIYTPYQPNAAALAAGYAAAPPCGAYGNRNFWLYYTDWFGSTQSPGGNAIVAAASAAGNGLGADTTGIICGLRGGGCFQAFTYGSVYWSPSTGARTVRGAIRDQWATLRWETGPLGYPTGEEICGLTGGGCFQTFQGGSMYWSPASGAYSVREDIYDTWQAQKWETGPLGYPTTDQVCGLASGGCSQTFQGGRVYWTKATGARAVAGPVYDAWQAQQRETGALGYPTGELRCGLRDGGCYQTFQGGSVYTTPADGVRTVRNVLQAAWRRLSYENGAFGYPTTDTACGLARGGCAQTFQGGRIYWSPASGAQTVPAGPVGEAWRASGAERGPLGYPTGDTTCGRAGGGCAGAFEKGAIYWTPDTGARVVAGAVLTRYAAAGAERGPLGYPREDQFCGLVRGGCFQVFTGGLIYRTPATGTRVVAGDVFSEWAARTWERGQLGYPAGELTCGLRDGGCFQLFEGGMIYTAKATGTHTVLGAIRGAWAAQRWETGPLGYPTGNEVCGQPRGGCAQQFQGGTIQWSPATGARLVYGAIGEYWTATKGLRGPLGYPIGDPFPGLVRGGWFQVFTGGSIYWSPATGAHAVRGAIRTAWGRAGWERGSLGYPVADATTSATEVTQRFQGGTLVQNRSTGKVTRR